jgi:putative membrane protein insertion efficiency factor
MKALLLAAIHLYKRAFSPTLLSSCRFTPSCSDYALEAIERHGAFFGTALALGRILRCNPFTRGGLDLVPTKLHRQDIRTHSCQMENEKETVKPLAAVRS